MVSNINKIEIRNCVVDELHVRERTDAAIDITSAKDTWALDSYMLGLFKDNLEAGNIGLGGLPITNFRVKRRRLDSLVFNDIGIVPIGQDHNFYFIDPSSTSGVIYEYEVSPLSNDIEGNSYSVQIMCKFDYWWLTDENESYPFFANLEVSDINNNMQRYVYEGFNEFPTISYGVGKYQSGTITAILMDNFLTVNTSVAYRDSVMKFINNKKPKYMKNPDGDIWMVDTRVSKYKIFTETVQNLSQVTFDWTEIAKVDK